MRSNGWQNEFVLHQSHSRSETVQGKQAILPPSQDQYVAPNWQSAQYNINDGYMGMAFMPYAHSRQQQMQEQQQSQQQAEPSYDEAGFADAFEQASQYAQEMVKDDNEKSVALEQDGSDLLHKDAILLDHSQLEDHSLPSLAKPPSPTQIRIGSDTIPYQEQKARTPDQASRDADELARTAGQLLASVQHDTSDKFQNSQFLALMRKIRDGEVRVEGEEFKETYGNDQTVSNLVKLCHTTCRRRNRPASTCICPDRGSGRPQSSRTHSASSCSSTVKGWTTAAAQAHEDDAHAFNLRKHTARSPFPLSVYRDHFESVYSEEDD